MITEGVKICDTTHIFYHLSSWHCMIVLCIKRFLPGNGKKKSVDIHHFYTVKTVIIFVK